MIDLTSDTFVDMYPLGVKSWKNLLLDASDKDGGRGKKLYLINCRNLATVTGELYVW